MTDGRGPADTARRTVIEAVFEEALDLTPDRRSGWLAARCGADADLRHEVEGLLAAFERPDELLDGSAAPFAALAATLAPELGGRRTIGPYRILREIGRGGMGVVYLADRNDGQYHHRVAIKLLSAGHQAGGLYQRFLAERQILATLSHPNIAQLLDGGITEHGVPYLVMEYVDGSPITTRCEQEQLGLEARLQLFRAACAAVHHAHANLVLHLDVKPANILVTRDGQVKLLDFGIAKLLAPRPVSDGDPLTQTVGRPMTPAYASPEQVSGGSLSTASDVYALGLVLYELLTGVRALGEQASAEHEPVRPSLHPTPHAHQLRGDLDAIVMMALRREPERRYGSADLFSEDLGRYLDGQPVLAHRGSASYRLRKLVRRHRVAATGALLGISALVGGIAATTWQARVAQREQLRATSAMAESEEVTRFLVGMFGPGQLVAGTTQTAVSVDAILEDGAARAELLKDRPLVQARMFEVLGQIHHNLGHLASADSFGTRAVHRWRDVLAPGDLRLADAMVRLAETRRLRGAYQSADSLVTAALVLRRAELGNSHPDVASALRQRSILAVYLNDLDGAVTLIREAIAIRRAASGEDSALVADLHTLASSLWRKGETREGMVAYRESATLALRIFAAPHPERVRAQLRLAERLATFPPDREEAVALGRAALAEARAIDGEAGPATGRTLSSVAVILGPRGGHETELMLRQALEIQRRVAPGLPDEAFTLTLLAEHLVANGDSLREAETLHRRAVGILSQQFGPSHSSVAGALEGLANAQLNAGRLVAAESTFLAAVSIRATALGRDNFMVAYTSLGLARVASARGEIARADSIYASSRALLSRTLLGTHPDVIRIDSIRAALRRPPQPAGVLPSLTKPQ